MSQVIVRRDGDSVSLEATGGALFNGVATKMLLGDELHSGYIKLLTGTEAEKQPTVKETLGQQNKATSDNCVDPSCQGCSLLHTLLAQKNRKKKRPDVSVTERSPEGEANSGAWPGKGIVLTSSSAAATRAQTLASQKMARGKEEKAKEERLIKEGPAWVLKRSKELGNFYASTRPLEVGETIMRTKPDCWAPLFPLEEGRRWETVPWASTKLLTHLQQLPSLEELSSTTFLVIEALHLESKDPSAWEKLMSLESHLEKRDARELMAWEKWSHALCQAIKREAGESFQAAAAMKILGIVSVNSLATRDGLVTEPSGVGLFIEASMFAHSCLPNCYTDFALDEEGFVTIKAQEAVSLSHPLTISYVDAMEPTYHRQRCLMKTKLFRCTCKLCQDEGGTELKRHTGSLACQANHDGREGNPPGVHAVLPVGTEPGLPWFCSSCGVIMQWSQVETLDRELREALENAEGLVAANLPEKAVEVYRKLIEACVKYCHPNHSLLFQARVGLVSYCLREPKTKEGIREKIGTLEEVTRVAGVILPAKDAMKADLFYQLGCAHYGLSNEEKDDGAHLEAATEAFVAAYSSFQFCFGQKHSGTIACHELLSSCIQRRESCGDREELEAILANMTEEPLSPQGRRWRSSSRSPEAASQNTGEDAIETIMAGL